MCSNNSSVLNFTYLNQTLTSSSNGFKNEISFIRLYIIPTVCLFGTISNFLNIVVFVNKKMKDISFKYMILISLSDMTYLGLLLYASIIWCETCSFYSYYFTKLYEFIIDYYITSCLAILSILTEISLSVHRSLILLNKCQKISFRIPLIIIIVISFIYYTPELFFYQIIYYNDCETNQIKYKIIYTKFGSMNVSKTIDITLASVRIILGVGVLTLVNVINVIIFNKKSLKPFKNLNNKNKKSKF